MNVDVYGNDSGSPKINQICGEFFLMNSKNILLFAILAGAILSVGVSATQSFNIAAYADDEDDGPVERITGSVEETAGQTLADTEDHVADAVEGLLGQNED
jgi:hypothetical protein